jgi:hypothetical protein
MVPDDGLGELGYRFRVQAIAARPISVRCAGARPARYPSHANAIVQTGRVATSLFIEKRSRC